MENETAIKLCKSTQQEWNKIHCPPANLFHYETFHIYLEM